MFRFLKHLFRGLPVSSAESKSEPIHGPDIISKVQAPSKVRDKPETLIELEADERIERPKVFDPAVKQFPQGFRHGEPSLRDASMELRWRSTKRKAMQSLLNLFTHSEWIDHLVLRGSATMESFVGSAAREPGDLDWVVRPSSMAMNEKDGRALIADLVLIIRHAAAQMDPEMDADRLRIDDIWTYERAQGRRIAIPWHVPDLPEGVLQMDFVFGESLPTEPVKRSLQLAMDLPAVNLWTASQELSLAWKILWLETDMHPQGKDLYDAVLLAERCELSPDLLLAVFRNADVRTTIGQLLLQKFPHREVDWENFIREYPAIQGSVGEWKDRLAAALRWSFGKHKFNP